jgi:hypothetical protein
MQFRTQLPTVSSPNKIRHTDSILTVGSCFSENIGNKLKALQFSVLQNPNGILFQPLAIANCLLSVLKGNLATTDDLIFYQNSWHSLAHHGQFSDASAEKCLEKINKTRLEAHEKCHNLDFLFVTYGTANVFEYKKTGQFVANCHKLPNADFERKRLKVDEIVDALVPIFQQLKTHAPNLTVVQTVSPIRHIRDGLIENQKSKATLILAAEEIQNALSFVQYFPAYELLLDDLRDYRFYETDMIHPSSVAIDYIWAYFEAAFFEKQTLILNQKIANLQKAAAHRPVSPNTDLHRQFCKQQLSEIANLQAVYPFLDFQKERTHFESFFNKKK